MNATAQPLSIFDLSPTRILDNKQVDELGIFGSTATRAHNRSMGKPGPKYIKISGRVFYRVSDLLAYLTSQAEASERDMAARRQRYERTARHRQVEAA